jgi:hypothetical protein
LESYQNTDRWNLPQATTLLHAKAARAGYFGLGRWQNS